MELKDLFEAIAFSPDALLTKDIGASDTIIYVDNVSAFPPGPGLATIGVDAGAETIKYGTVTENALSGCERGIEGTAKAWTAGEKIARNFTAREWNDLRANLDAIVEELKGAAKSSEHKWIEYNNLNDIGLTAGSETFEAILAAMPNSSKLRYIVTSSHNKAIYPWTYGVCEIEKANASYANMMFYVSHDNSYRGVYEAYCLGSSNVWTVSDWYVSFNALRPPTASDVGALKVYTSLSQLGLSEDTATAEQIVNAMDNNSMLLHKLGDTATSATLKFPYNYSTLKVMKLSASYTPFECIATGNLPTSYAYYNGGSSTKWSGWSTQYLPLDGSMAMSGGLQFNNGYGYLFANNVGSFLFSLKTAGSTSDSRRLGAYNSVAIQNALQFSDFVGGKATNYNLFGEHNKELLSGELLSLARDANVWTGNVFYTKQADGTVIINADITLKTTGTGVWNDFATLPVGYRPSNWLYFPMCDAVGNIALLRITSEGVLAVKQASIKNVAGVAVFGAGN